MSVQVYDAGMGWTCVKVKAVVVVISMAIGATMAVYVDYECRQQARLAERFLAFVSIGMAFDTVQSMASAVFPLARVENRDGGVELVIPVSYVLGGQLVIGSEDGMVVDAVMRTHDVQVSLTRARATAGAYGMRGGHGYPLPTDVIFAAVSAYVLITAAGSGLCCGVAWLSGTRPALPGRVDAVVLATAALSALVLSSVSRVVSTLQLMWMQ